MITGQPSTGTGGKEQAGWKMVDFRRARLNEFPYLLPRIEELGEGVFN